MSGNRIPEDFWDENKKRFNSHGFFKTINHHHICDYSGDEKCDIMIVECSDGRWYIEDNWGGDAKGADGVFNPFDKDSYPTFYDSCREANLRAATIVSEITGANISDLMVEE